MKRIYLDGVKPLTHYQKIERRRHVDYQHLKYFINRLPDDIYIKDRSGLLTKICSRIDQVSFEMNCFHICENIECSPDNIKSYTKQARRHSPNLRAHLMKVVLINWCAEPPVNSSYSVEVLSTVSLALLRSNDGIIYLEEHDLVLMYGLTEEEALKIDHPYSLVGYVAKSFSRIEDEYIRHGDFSFNIRIVDNQGTFGSKWILINDKKAFCIIACQDTEVTDGVYITYTENKLGGKGPKKLFTDRFAFDALEELPFYKLFDSEQEALASGGEIARQEAQAKLFETETKLRTAENNLKKAQQDKERLEQEAEARKEEHELNREKRDSEKASIYRKNTADIIKYVPVILLVVTNVIAALNKKQ